MYCKHCGEVMKNDKAVICVSCGTKKGEGYNYCADCGVQIQNTNADVCLNCGVSLKGLKLNLSSVSGKRNNKVLAGLLALFIGTLGIHRFYLGYKEIGFIQLGIFLAALFVFEPVIFIGSIWAFYDAIQIFIGKLPTANGEILE